MLTFVAFLNANVYMYIDLHLLYCIFEKLANKNVIF